MPNSNLFNLTTEQLELSTHLTTKIITEINNKGSIPFSQYMNMALYDRDFGYYNNLSHKFGYKGDFITAPGVSDLFAKMISRQLSELFDNGVPPCILEFGAGNGQLLLDILDEIGDRLVNYYILEISSDLSQLQQNRLREIAPQFLNKVIWLDKLPLEFKGIVLANEVLDAQPCELVQWQGGKISSLNVTYTNNQFLLVKEQANPELYDIAKDIPVLWDHVAEINLNNRAFVKTLAQCLSFGCILLIDYGYSEREYYAPHRFKGTLRGFFRQHVVDDVFIYPGLIDITSSVDFTAIANSAINHGLDLVGYVSQESFLLNCGIVEYVIAQENKLTPQNYLKLTQQLNKLTSINEMGEIFKVMSFSKGFDFIDWIGFNLGDRSYSL